ncbi:hypothetical protein [Flavobacterium phragmitis]|uniref:Uncharacterized protein n=1 Tax=Flavobacterium phragmitis TaxID=739143 RepID=A0A1I1RWK3_9FLAO|nr:hypothetical protein [Flavobacterium phragmitis]SFD38635.1 hypothetical protein SAMN05216297_107194 [Flavobacterium phragmitis]
MGLRATVVQLSQEELDEVIENPIFLFNIEPSDENHKSMDID